MSIIRIFPKRARSYGPAPAPMGIVWHMAEGGNTANYLTSEAVKASGNSSHIVIENDGDIVQVLPIDEIAGSISPRLIRTDNDAAFVGYVGQLNRYGIYAAKNLLGSHYTNPNPYLIQIEVEGFARRGPNRAQRIACRLLTRELRSTYPTLKGNLAHRDFQNYKACPGKLIPWASISGHGAFND